MTDRGCMHSRPIAAASRVPAITSFREEHMIFCLSRLNGVLPCDACSAVAQHSAARHTRAARSAELSARPWAAFERRPRYFTSQDAFTLDSRFLYRSCSMAKALSAGVERKGSRLCGPRVSFTAGQCHRQLAARHHVRDVHFAEPICAARCRNVLGYASRVSRCEVYFEHLRPN